MAPSLSSHPEEQQDIFSFEEQENDDLNQTSYLPADDEGDTTDGKNCLLLFVVSFEVCGSCFATLLGTEGPFLLFYGISYLKFFILDSGTGEDYRKYYPPPPPPPSANSSAATLVGQPRTISSSGHNRTVHYCTSLPVRVPDGASGHWSQKITDNSIHGGSDMKLDDDENEEEDEEADEKLPELQPKDVGASMQALARSIQSADDPERLFGERPQRRRWKTGEDFQQQPQIIPARDVFPVENRRKATVVVLFKEEQNF